MQNLQQIYNKLLMHFSHQNWWPITREGEELPKYHVDIHKKDLSDKEKFEIAVGAILTQNTSWKNVEKAIINLNKNKLMSPFKIISITKNKLAEIIRASGYHNQKAEKLKIFSNWLINNYNGSLGKFFVSKDTKELRKELLEIKGIGPETADSILLYAGNKLTFVVDAYTKRIFSRIGFKEEDYHKLQEIFMKALPEDTILYKEYHALIVELGKNVCRKEPLCNICPLNTLCRYWKESKSVLKRNQKNWKIIEEYG